MSNVLGQLTEEEHTIISTARQRGQQCMLRIGETSYQISKIRQQLLLLESQLNQQLAALRDKEAQALRDSQALCDELEGIEKEGRNIIEQVTSRLGLEPGVQWVALQDGVIQRVEK